MEVLGDRMRYETGTLLNFTRLHRLPSLRSHGDVASRDLRGDCHHYGWHPTISEIGEAICPVNLASCERRWPVSTRFDLRLLRALTLR